MHLLLVCYLAACVLWFCAFVCVNVFACVYVCVRCEAVFVCLCVSEL